MNCFNNNVPKLTSAEHLRNKRSKTLYNSKVLDFKRGKSKGNINFYKNGKIRTTTNYQNKLDITRGYSLCTLGDVSGCKKNHTQHNIINTGIDSIYNMFDGHSIDSSNIGFPVLQSWENGFCRDISNGPPFINKFANIDDVSNKPGNYIVIDPCNNLFGTNNCVNNMTNRLVGVNKYLQYTSLLPGYSCKKKTYQNYMQYYKNNVSNVKLSK